MITTAGPINVGGDWSGGDPSTGEEPVDTVHTIDRFVEHERASAVDKGDSTF